MTITETNFNIDVPHNNNPSFIIIHHSLAKSCTIYDIHRWHLAFGWAGCGYHFFIDKSGKIYRGREEEQRGSHCKEESMNYKSIGICLEGCYEEYKNQTEKEVPLAQLNALTSLSKYLMKKYGIGVENIKKHHDLASYKLCPGNYFPWSIYLSKLQEERQDEIIKLREENEKYKSKIIYFNRLLDSVSNKLSEIEGMLRDGKSISETY